ncbi:MAG: SpoIVB peptidase [Lawsonibacter sp.]|nr:SpoIVB peptidase [Lawsonibacter sp.]
MEQDTKHRPWALLPAGAALLLGLALTLLLARDGVQAASGAVVLQLPRTPAAAAPAALETGRKVVPLGRAVGIKLFSNGVLVVGLSDLETSASTVSPGRSCGLKTGDIITHINAQEVDTIEQVQAIVTQDGGQPLILQVDRGGRSLQLSAQAVQNNQGVYQLGVWLRDSMAGIGTMTYYDPDSRTFAALGHGVNDVDTSLLMPLETGSIMYASVSDVKRGTAGEPGELHGNFDVYRDLGILYANTQTGIYGVLSGSDFDTGSPAVEIASRDQVKVGPASILSNIDGEAVEEYAVEITHVYPAAAGETRNLMVQVTDPELLEKTGGIVQGMSGSPILQDGRLVGAVTHVLINDPTRGYGILAENMAAQTGREEQAAVS